MKQRTTFVLVMLSMAAYMISNVRAEPQQSNAPAFSSIAITMKTEGGPCGCVSVNDEDLSCCPAYSVSISGDGTVTYEGVTSVKVKGKRIYEIPIESVKELVEIFHSIGFFSMED